MEQLQRITVGEKKFRAMVDDLMVMDKPSMNIDCTTSSKARSLRRQFYTWRTNLAEMERKFMEHLEFRVTGRYLAVIPKADWTPVEKGVANVSEDQGKSA